MDHSGTRREPKMHDPESWIDVRPGELILRLLVQPRARSAGVVGVTGDRLKVRVTEPPTDGRANAAVTRLIAELAGVPRTTVGLSHGAGSRQKTLRIMGGNIKGAASRLQAAADACANRARSLD